MWQMLQRWFTRRPRRTVLTRLRLHVEALENRLVPSGSPLSALVAMKTPAYEGALKSPEIKKESKVTVTPHVHKSEQQFVPLKESDAIGSPVEPDQPVHGYKWRRRWPWEVGADAKFEVMPVHFDVGQIEKMK
jgi:hypothetical protein